MCNDFEILVSKNKDININFDKCIKIASKVELEEAEVTIKKNGTNIVVPNAGFDGLSKVTINTDVIPYEYELDYIGKGEYQIVLKRPDSMKYLSGVIISLTEDGAGKPTGTILKLVVELFDEEERTYIVDSSLTKNVSGIVGILNGFCVYKVSSGVGAACVATASVNEDDVIINIYGATLGGISNARKLVQGGSYGITFYGS